MGAKKVVNRRRFLKALLGLAGALKIGGCSALGYGYYSMKMAPERDGKLFFDMHAHIPNYAPQDELLEVLSTHGITGLASWRREKTILTYEQALNMPGVKEIDKGYLAEVVYKGNKGYIFKVQEVRSKFHILALGCPKEIDESLETIRVLEEVYRQGRLPVIAHPYVNANVWNKPFVQKEDYRMLSHIYQMVEQLGGEVEVFNGICIDIMLGFNRAKANELGKNSISGFPNIKGTAASDTHRRLEQVKTNGIYLPADSLSLEAITFYIGTGQYEIYEQSIARVSAVAGFVEGRIKGTSPLADIVAKP
ncbi:MAG TPA: hypothetical protein VJI46_00120 [Candidatus Nanoarchaeia archaeon]|nr:hypothetical protein [Candidatus Nanoarchaeia archaeon]